VVIGDTHTGADLDKSFTDREHEWRAAIPLRLLNAGRFQTTALDETNTRRFLPTFLCKCSPPRDVSDPMTIARMVRCITFQQDAHIKKEKKKATEPIWSSPTYFLDVRKGASEDHAILMCNLFLGLGLDAYLAIGKLPGGIQQHVWVVTREPTGDVKFWETTKGCCYTLPARCQSVLLEGAGEVAALQMMKVQTEAHATTLDTVKKDGAKRDKGEPLSHDDKRYLRALEALAEDKRLRDEERAKREKAELQKREEKLLYHDDEEPWTQEGEIDPYETPRDYRPDGAEGASAGGGLGSAGGGLRALREVGGDSKSFKSMAKVVDKFAIKADPKAIKADPKALLASILKPVKEVPAGAEGEGKDTHAPMVGRVVLGQAERLAELTLPPLMERIPYDTIEVLVNHENLWANLQDVAITEQSFNLESDEDRWLPFNFPLGLIWRDMGPARPDTNGRQLENQLLHDALLAHKDAHRMLDGMRVKFSEIEFSKFQLDPTDGATEPFTRDDYIYVGGRGSGVPGTYFMPLGGLDVKPFYSVGRIGPKLPSSRLMRLRRELYLAIKYGYQSWRGARGLRTHWHRNLEPVLEQGLATYEMAACSSLATDRRAVDKWRGRLLAALPPDYLLVGRALTFSITSPEMIVEHLLNNYDYHQKPHKDVGFLLAVQVFPHYAAIASVWVYVGNLVPHAKGKGKRKANVGGGSSSSAKD
jgi:hypothetical protein